MKNNDNRFFITKSRLLKPNFYKSIEMMLLVNPKAPVTMPSKHQDWVGDNWHTISPGNAFLALRNGAGYFNWKVHPDQANLIFDVILASRDVDHFSVVLSSEILTEQRMVGFISKELPSYGQRISDFLGYILQNKSLKTYQFEMIHTYLKNELLTPELCNGMALELIPDHLFKTILQRSLKWKPRESSYHRDESNPYVRTISEGYRRKMLVLQDVPTVVASMPKPTFAASASNVVQVPEIKKVAPTLVIKY